MRTLFIFSILLLLLPLSLWAGVGFVHESGFSVTPFSPTLSTTSLVRLDQSGNLGLLWKQGPTVRLYDPAGDSILFSHTSDTIELVLSAIVLDISGDISVDIVILTAKNFMAYELTEWRLTCFDGASGYTDSTVLLFNSSTTPSAVTSTGIYLLLDAIDFDQDGRNELLFSYSNVSEGWGQVNESGYTEFIDHFPDSLLPTRHFLTRSVTTFLDATDTTRTLFQAYGRNYYDFMGGYDLANSFLFEMRDLYHMLAISPDCSVIMCLDGGNFDHCSYQPIIAGDFSQNFPGEEFLVRRDHTVDCPDSGMYITTSELLLGKVDDTLPGEMQLLWTVPYPSQFTGVGNFIVHPDLPGYFFGIAGDTLIMFNGDNGSIRTTSTDLPLGQRYWDNNWPDSLPRLVVMNGHQVDIYTMDITTDADDDAPSALPFDFLLGKPYPNPFNAETTIPINLPKHGNLKVEIYNLLGQTVATLVDRELPAGETRLTWDASDKPSGVYLVRAVSGDKTETRKLLLLK